MSTIIGCEVSALHLYWAPWQDQAVIYGIAQITLAYRVTARYSGVPFKAVTTNVSISRPVPLPAPGSLLVVGTPGAETLPRSARGMGPSALMQVGVTLTVPYEFQVPAPPLGEAAVGELESEPAPVPAGSPTAAEPLPVPVPEPEVAPAPELPPVPGPAPQPQPALPEPVLEAEVQPPRVSPPQPRDMQPPSWETTLRRYASQGKKLPRAFSTLLETPRYRGYFSG